MDPSDPNVPIIGKHTTLAFGQVNDGGTETGDWTVLGRIRDIKPPTQTVGSAESTTYDDDAETFVPGFYNGGETEFELRYAQDQSTVLDAMVGDDMMYAWLVTYRDGATEQFDGFITSCGKSAPLKGLVTEKFKIKVSGRVEYTA